MDFDGISMDKLKIHLEEPMKTFLKHTTKQHLEEDFIGNTFATRFFVSRDLGGFETQHGNTSCYLSRKLVSPALVQNLFAL